MRRGTTKAADYWALGVLIFEMLVGDPPFKSLTGDPWDTFRRTLSGRFYVSRVAAGMLACISPVDHWAAGDPVGGVYVGSWQQQAQKREDQQTE
jgi:serine/threonine protein kinase